MSIDTPLELPTGLKLKNRLVKAATTEGLADKNNFATAELAQFYDTYATNSGCGLIITGNVIIDRRYLERPRNTAIDAAHTDSSNRENQLERFKTLVKAATQNDTKVVCQLNHVGRFAIASIANECIAPGAVTKVAKFQKFATAREITAKEIEDVVERFGFAAEFCEEAGFHGVQIHFAYGFLLSSFLSKTVNNRTDEFGESLANKLKPIFMCIERVKESVSEGFLLSVKVDTVDLKNGGLSVDESVSFLCDLAAAGISLVELNGGNYEKSTGKHPETGIHESTKKRYKYYIAVIQELNKQIELNERKLAVLLTGGFRLKEAMNRAIKQGDGNLIGIGKPLCIDVSCTNRLLAGDIDELPRPDDSWKLPWFLGWKPFVNYYWNYRLKKKCIELTMYQNLVEIGSDTFKTQSNSDYPNILLTSTKRLAKEAEEAKENTIRVNK